MATLKIKLVIDEEEKVFTAPFIRARMYRRALELMKEYDLETNMSLEALDALVEFTAEVFGNKFTDEQLYDGFPGPELNDKLIEVIQAVTGTAYKESKENLDNVTSKN